MSVIVAVYGGEPHALAVPQRIESDTGPVPQHLSVGHHIFVAGVSHLESSILRMQLSPMPHRHFHSECGTACAQRVDRGETCGIGQKSEALRSQIQLANAENYKDGPLEAGFQQIADCCPNAF